MALRIYLCMRLYEYESCLPVLNVCNVGTAGHCHDWSRKARLTTFEWTVVSKKSIYFDELMCVCCLSYNGKRMNTEAKEATLIAIRSQATLSLLTSVAQPSQVVGNAQVLEVNSDWKDGGGLRGW